MECSSRSRGGNLEFEKQCLGGPENKLEIVRFGTGEYDLEIVVKNRNVDSECQRRVIILVAVSSLIINEIDYRVINLGYSLTLASSIWRIPSKNQWGTIDRNSLARKVFPE